jgi:aerobic carbon-monoxide dehydrogenase large subunit
MKISGRADGVGASRLRTEDTRLVTGQGSYIDDLTLANQSYAVVLRSPHAHARILSIDTAKAQAVPDVLVVLTGQDVAADGLGPIPHNVEWSGPPDVELRLPDGYEVFLTDHPLMPADRVRYLG